MPSGSDRSPYAAFGTESNNEAVRKLKRQRDSRRGFFALGIVAVLAISVGWNPPTGSVHSFSKASDFNEARDSGCTNSGKGCHGSETSYKDFNDYHPNAKCTSCHEYQGVGCIPCHSPTNSDCPVCHDGTMENAPDRVRLSDPYPKGHYRETTHTATGTDMRGVVRAAFEGTAQAACKDCHSRDLKQAHTGVPVAGDSPYGTDIGCGECHNDTRSFGQKRVLDDWRGRACEDCHAEKSSTPMHPADVANAVESTGGPGCGATGAGCHESADVHGLHADAPKDCSGSAATGEPGCHDLALESHEPTATTCGGAGAATCHLDYVNDEYTHKEDGDLHSPKNTAAAGDNSYFGTLCGACHLMAADGHSLTDEHALATSEQADGPDLCRGCHNHPASAEAIASDWDARDTAGACSACHGDSGLDSVHTVDISDAHLADDSAGCALTGPGCHPTADLSAVGIPTTTTGLHRDCLRCHDRTKSDGNAAYVPGDDSCGAGRECHGAAGAYTPATSVHAGDTRVDGADTAHHAAGQGLRAARYTDALTGLSTPCVTCHQTVLAPEHLRPNSGLASGRGTICWRCHSANAASGAVVKADWPAKATAAACADCHGTASASAAHTGIATAHNARELNDEGVIEPGACAKAGCHISTDLRALHAEDGCATSGCHASANDIRGLGIVSCGGTNPERSCHVAIHSQANGSDIENHLAGEAQRTAFATEPVSGLAPECGTCHSMLLGPEHERPNSSIATGTAGTLCSRCHDASAFTRTVVREEWVARETAEACVACHGHADTPAPHTNETTAHAASELSAAGEVESGSCVTRGCHQTTDVRRLHRNQSCTIEGCHVHDDDIRGANLMSCGGEDDATACHAGINADEHDQDHSADLTGTVGTVTYGIGENVGCFGCHTRDLITEHSAALMVGSMEASSSGPCHVCHEDPDDADGSANARLAAVRDAIATGDRRCVACHSSGSDTDGPDAVASPHKDVSAATTLPPGKVWADPVDEWRTALDATTGGGHNALPADLVGASNASPFPRVAFDIGGAAYNWVLAPNTSTTTWLRNGTVITTNTIEAGVETVEFESATTTEGIMAATVTCEDCHELPADMNGPQGAAVRVTIDPDYSQTEYANPSDGTFQFDPFNVEDTNITDAGSVPTVTVVSNNPPGYKPVICVKCHLVYTRSRVDTSAVSVGGNGLHSTHRSRHDMIPTPGVRGEACVDCHVRIPHAWKRPRLLVRTVETSDGIAPDAYPYVAEGHTGLVGVKLIDIATPTTLTRQACAAGGCYGNPNATNHPRPSQIPTATYWP